MEKHRIKNITLGLFLALCIVTDFTACNTALMEKSQLEKNATGDVKVPVGALLSQVMSREAASGIYTLKLEFASGYETVSHNKDDVMEITSDNLEGFKDADFTMSVTEIPLYTKVAFKISIFQGDDLIYKGESKPVTIGLDTKTLLITAKKAERLPVFHKKASSDAQFFQFVALNKLKSIETETSLIGVDETSRVLEMDDFCADKKGNYYVLYGNSVKRYSYGDDAGTVVMTATIENVSGDVKEWIPKGIYYDYYTDSLYMLERTYNLEDTVLKITQRENPDENSGATQEWMTDLLDRDVSIYDFAVYGDQFYFIYMINEGAVSTYHLKRGALATGTVSEGPSKKILTNSGSEDDRKDAVAQDLLFPESENSADFTKRFNFTDIAVNKDGVFILVSDNEAFSEEQKIIDSKHYSRGAILKLDDALSKCEAYGWTDTKYNIYWENTSNELLWKHTNYIPKSIDAGFYGPQKFLLVKENKLIFADDGGWHNVKVNDSNTTSGYVKLYDIVNVTQENHVVFFDTEKNKWTAEETNAEFYIKASAELDYASADESYTYKWE